MTAATPRWRRWPSVRLAYRWLDAFVPVRRTALAIAGVGRYCRDLRRYNALAAEPVRLRDSFPVLTEWTEVTDFDAHYLYQAVWAAQHVRDLRPTRHVDVGSDVRYVAMLAPYVPVTFVDIRPLRASIDNLVSIAGDLGGRLPFENGSVTSLSCLHVAEHVGLGRYGDRLDPDGTRHACQELTRILAPGGHLLFSVPVGRSRVCFNAHRIHAPREILGYFDGLELVELAGVDDAGRLLADPDPDDLATLDYGLGLFHLTRAGATPAGAQRVGEPAARPAP